MTDSTLPVAIGSDDDRSPLIIALGSLNSAKRRSVEMALTQLFPSRPFTIHPYDVPSTVRPQPLSALETLTGAHARALSAQRLHLTLHPPPSSPVPHYSIGIEGGIESIHPTLHLEAGYVVVLDPHGQRGVGTSGRYEVSAAIMRHLEGGRELGDVIDELVHEKEVRQSGGMMGLITRNQLPRDVAYSHGVMFAFAPFVSSPLFWDAQPSPLLPPTFTTG